VNTEEFLGWLDNKNQPFLIPSSEKPLIMGVLNVTPDSFSDGGCFLSSDKASEHALTLIEQGADILDVGGESSRPGSLPVSVDVELSRVIPVIEQIRKQSDVCISIDTYKPEVMCAAVHAGANIINDIYALRTKNALTMAAQLDVPICLMHMQGTPSKMQQNPQYSDGVVNDVTAFFKERVNACLQEGIIKERLILDPGFGFGKSVRDNLEVSTNLDKFQEFGIPILLGVSRKSTIGALLNKEIHNRLIGSIALTVYAALKGVSIIRTHDVAETNQALQMIAALGKVD